MTVRRALVTGAGARLGQAMAKALGEDGWHVGVHYRHSRDGAEATARAIETGGGHAELLQADLSVEEETQALIAQAAEALGGPLTLLVNSASTFVNDAAKTHSRDDWNFHFEPNLRAPVLLSQGFAQHLPDTKKGLIVNIIDARVWNLTPDYFTYTLSKSALWAATQTLAMALAPRIRVNAIGPGPTLQNAHQDADAFEADKAATLTGEGSCPAEIINALRYLITASSVTGQMIASDGGEHLMWPT